MRTLRTKQAENDTRLCRFYCVWRAWNMSWQIDKLPLQVWPMAVPQYFLLRICKFNFLLAHLNIPCTGNYVCKIMYTMHI